ncbi:MAG: LCP family protein, partial [Candidatus Dormibacteraceae bacterium]
PPGSGGGRPRGTAHMVLLVSLVVLGFVIAAGGGTGAYFFPLARAAAEDTGHSGATTPRPHPSSSTKPLATPTPSSSSGAQPFTVLLLGSDNDGKEGNNQTPLTQSVILVRVNPQAGSVTMLSLPRDLWIPCYGAAGGELGTQKLDACFTGGTFPNQAAAAMVQTVENNFNVRVDDWAWIGLQGLVNLINFVGGVDVVATNPVMDDLYPADVGTSNPYGYQRLAILPGAQHMSGQQALNFVRTRHASFYGDFSRSARQQEVLVALREKLQNLSPSDLPAIESAMQGQFYTSMSVPRIASLLPLAGKIKNGSINQITLASSEYTSQQTIQDSSGPDDIVVGNTSAIEQLMWQYFPEAS